MSRILKGIQIGDIKDSNICGKFRIDKVKGAYSVHITFLDTGTKSIVAASAIRRGSVGDSLAKTVFGVGCIGFGEFKSRINNSSSKTQEYRGWENMLARCYYPKTSRYSAYGAIGVVVCEEWKNFQTFAKWHVENYIDGYHLDSDILTQHSIKIYSPDTSIYVPQGLNGLFVNNYKNREKVSKLPEGVSPCKDTNYRYQSGVSISGKVTNSKRFVSIEEACNYYDSEKTKLVREFVEDYYSKGLIEDKVYLALKGYEFIRRGVYGV